MGTRADFYVGRGPQAEWLGSIAYDGHPFPVNVGAAVLDAATEAQFRAAVDERLAATDSGTRPADGWPWSWADSRTTDYAYAWDEGCLWCTCFGYRWFRPSVEPEPDLQDTDKEALFPDMTSRQCVTFGPRSGVMLIRLPPSQS